MLLIVVRSTVLRPFAMSVDKEPNEEKGEYKEGTNGYTDDQGDFCIVGKSIRGRWCRGGDVGII